MRAGERIHLIGIAGSGAAGVALLLHHAGARIDGCDADTPSPYTPPLDAAGIRVALERQHSAIGINDAHTLLGQAFDAAGHEGRDACDGGARAGTRLRR